MKHTLLLPGALLVGLAGTPLRAQDTTASTTPDTTARPRDTTTAAGSPGAAPQRPDTSAGQSGVRPDTLAPDSLRRDTTTPGSRPAGAPAPAAAPAARPAPVDSALAAACRESGGEPPDLLTVVFRASATAAEREAAARAVGGTLVEPSRHQAPGAWYLHVPGSGFNPLVADRVILQPPVLEVSATRCPS